MTIPRWIFAGLLIAVVGLLAMKSLKPRARPPIRVHTAKARQTSITRVVSGAGKVEPIHKVNVSSNITGTLLDLKVQIGSKVKKGDYLGQIDTSHYKAQVEQARAQLRAAQANAKRAAANLDYLRGEETRLEKLVAHKVASAENLAKARSSRELADAEKAAADSQVRSARASLANATNSLRWATLTAPVDGTVLAINHHVGERVRGSDFSEDTVLVLGSLTDVDVRLEVGEFDIVYIKPRQPATIQIDALPGKVFHGHVIDSGRDAIVKNAGTENEVTTFPVWVSLDDPPKSALSGMSAQVDISTETHDHVVAVPIQAVTVRPAEKTAKAAKPVKTETPVKTAKAPPPAGLRERKLDKVVFVVKDGIVSKRVVTTGLSSDTDVEITDGLKAGEVVVDGPYRTLARQLKGGMRVARETHRK